MDKTLLVVPATDTSKVTDDTNFYQGGGLSNLNAIKLFLFYYLNI
jgi:hypothetical protein